MSRNIATEFVHQPARLWRAFTRAGRHPRRGRGSSGQPPSPRFNPRWRVRLFPGPSSSSRRFHPPPAGSSGLCCAAPLVCAAATTLPRPYGPLHQEAMRQDLQRGFWIIPSPVPSRA
ncbi:hypothetical protein J2Z49_002925 [Desulfofundulus luciae]|uniref:Uncharacterized protein n=1 Tax=Desulfofundulus luciae TaxID=74702 RepID=A0ABU0B508_9FIRM|nr:hypothetical protein [Desulfofundulus luciae]MDQ0287792.1 hypothetical protein [Desulfofundulus luciae]